MATLVKENGYHTWSSLSTCTVTYNDIARSKVYLIGSKVYETVSIDSPRSIDSPFSEESISLEGNSQAQLD